MDNSIENHLNNSNDKHLSGDELCDFAEGLLSESARVLAEKHLDSCEACRREISITGAYFKSLGQLEPVSAPAHFLAKVRARLEKPSPWQVFWERLANPWRFAPTQLAVLTILGITILASYLYQKDGLGPTSIIPPPSKHDGVESIPVLAKTLPQPENQFKKIEGTSPSEATRSSKPAPNSVPEAKFERTVTSQDNVPELQAESVAEEKNIQKYILSDAPASPAASASAPAMSAPPPSRATREWSAPKSGAAIADETQKTLEILLQSRSAKDTSTILSGLKAMGIEIISEHRAEGIVLILKVSSAAIPEVLSYLEGYGKMENLGASKP